MNEIHAKTIAELAAAIDGRIYGDAGTLIHGIASLEGATPGTIAFLGDAKFSDAARDTKASCVVVPEGVRPEGKNLIEVVNPKLAFARAAALLRPRPTIENFVHPTAIISSSARLDAPVSIGAHVTIGERTVVGADTEINAGARIGADVVIGRGCTIHPDVVLYDGVTIGARVVLHAGVCVGADGFGYVRTPETGEYVKFPQGGTVIVEDDVEIGANTCIDRAALDGETRVGAGTKIDNLVQIGHNVRIGSRVVIASQTGISGSTVIEDDCVIGGQVGFGDHARVERGAIIGSKAGVLPGKIVRGGGRVYWGVPLRPLEEYKVMNAAMGRLPQMRRELKILREKVRELEARLAAEAMNAE